MLKTLFRVLAGCIVGLLSLAAVLLAWPLPEMPGQGVAGDFLVRNVTVVDVEAGVLHEDQDVVVAGGRVASVAPAGTVPLQESLIPIDGTGKYLMPGLWDMHAHSLKISPQYHHPLFIANGVTGLREMGGCMSEPDSFFACSDDIERWSDALRDKSGLSPRHVLRSSFPINGGDGVPERMPEFFRARNAQEAREAGTDAGDTYVFPGFSIHEELAEFVSAGLTPAAALRTATIDAALFSGKESEFGSIDAGKTADMILLDADPLADIRNTRRIRGLFFNGQYFDRAALDELLEFAEQQASSIRSSLHLLWDALNSPIVRVQLAD